MNREWENIQQRTFTRWVNAQLRKRGMKIENLVTDLKDGIVLINLYEVISDEDLGKYNKKPKFKIHQLQNLKIVISEINKFVKSVGIRVQYEGDAVNKGDKRSILGLIWCLIHKFEIQDISEEELSAREGLLLWCKKKTAPYNNVKVKNFTTSWQDGLAFCALIHAHHPNLIDYDSLNGKNKKENLQKAFDIAEKEFDIPQLLDVDDMVSYKPDDKSVMTYVAYYWKKFAAGNKQQKFARKIGRVAENQRKMAEMIHDYEKRAKALIKWVSEKNEEYKDPDQKKFGNSLKKVQDTNGKFKNFKKKEKPLQGKEKSDLELLLTNLRSKQKSEGFPVYTPPEELSTATIQGHWDNLEETQKGYEKALKEAITRMKYLETLLGRYRARSKQVLSWQKDKEEFFAEDIDKKWQISTIRAKVNILKAFSDEKDSVKKTLDSTEEIGKEIVDAEHEAADEVTGTTIDMKKGHDKVSKDADKKTKELDELLKFKLEIEEKCVNFAKTGEKLNILLEEALLSLSEPVSASSVKDVENANDVLSKLKETHAGSAELITAMKEISKSVQEAGEDPAVFSRHTVDSLSKKYEDVKTKLGEKKTSLDEELKVQKKNAELLDEYSKACKAYIEWSQKALKSLQQDLDGKLEEQLKKLKEIGEKATKSSSTNLEKLVESNNKLEEADIAEQSEMSVQELQFIDDQISSTFSKRSKAIEEQILAAQMSSVSKEQLDDFHETFKYFDKNKNNKLNKNEFKAACASVGEDIPDNELDKVFKKFDKDKDGFINFQEFIQFMTSITKEGTTYEDILESFSSLAGGADYITEQQIRANMGKEDADYLCEVMPKVDGGFDYKKYAKDTYGK